jgi:nitroreductase
MELFEAIYGRQSLGGVKPDPVPRALIETLLNAAVQAPNHHKVRPWRFVVFAGAGRETLGEAMVHMALKLKPDALPEALDAERKKVRRAPVVIAVGVDQPNGPKVLEIENVCAAAGAAQNLLLAAHASGLAAIWRTGPGARDADVKALCGLAPDQHLIGFIYVGYPLAESAPVARPGAEDRTMWVE